MAVKYTFDKIRQSNLMLLGLRFQGFILSNISILPNEVKPANITQRNVLMCFR